MAQGCGDSFHRGVSYGVQSTKKTAGKALFSTRPQKEQVNGREAK